MDFETLKPLFLVLLASSGPYGPFLAIQRALIIRLEDQARSCARTFKVSASILSLIFWPGQSKTLGRALILFRALKALNGHALNQATTGLSGAKSLVLIHGDRFV